MIRLNRKSLLKFVLIFLAAVIAMELFVRFLDSRDTALPNVEKFLRSSSQVLDVVGEISDVSLYKRLNYEGVPGQEPPFQEYSFEVNGGKSNALVVIRAEQDSYRILRLEESR